ncbi:NACHT domain-containing protein [Phormidesmis sp. 146-33]
MLTSEELDAILERILTNKATEKDVAALRRSLKQSGKVVQIELQQEKFSFDIEQISGGEIQFGDRIYQGADAETIKAVLQSALGEQQRLLEQQRAKRPRVERDFLGMMKAEVSSSLKQSLHHAVLMNLGKEEQPEQVERLWDAKVKVADQPNVLLSKDAKTIEVFDREDIAGRLLILGSPGSGKTTTLLELAKELIERAETEQDFPMPVLFNLSSWKDDRQPLQEWIVQELKLRVRSDITRKWLDQHKLLPLLDGLDEMATDRQETCVEAINQQLLTGERSLPYLVVCSRNEEYDNYETKLLLNGAISIQALTIDKIRSYLNSIDQTELCHTLDHDAELLALVRIPLFLSIAVIAFQELSHEQWQTLTTTEARIRYLLNSYIQKMIRRKPVKFALKNKKDHPCSLTQKTYTWLVWLAIYMQGEAKSEFLIERVPPPRLARGSLVNVSITVFLTLVILFIFTLLKQGIELKYIIKIISIKLLLGGYPIYVAICLIVRNLMNKDIKIVEGLIWSWRKAKNGFRKELTYPQFLTINVAGGSVTTYICGTSSIHILCLIILMLSQTRSDNKIDHRLALVTLGALIVALLLSGRISLKVMFIVLMFRLTFGLINMLMHGLTPSEIEVKTFPNQGIWMSAKNAMFFFLTIAFIGGLLGGVLGLIDLGIVIPYLGLHFEGVLKGFTSGLLIGLFTGLLFGLQYGGITCIKYGVTRIILYSKGLIPWNYARFLNHCTERSILQRVGGRYRFIHRLLQEHFAAMHLDK